MRIAFLHGFKSEFPSETAANKFIAEFRAWKAAPDPCTFRLFGRNVLTKVQIGHNFDKLMHVHLVPLDDDASLQTWEWRFASKTSNLRCDRTSDRLLFYAVEGNDTLLIGFHQHSSAFSSNQVHDMCAIADRWVNVKNARKRTP